MIYGDNLIYVRIDWENYPKETTPLNEYNLDKMDLAIFQTDERVKWLNDNKFDKSESFKLVKDVEVEEGTGIFKIIFYDNTTKTYDTLLEKIATNWDYDPVSEKIILTLDDGEKKYIDLSSLVTQYEFMDSETIHFSTEERSKVLKTLWDESLIGTDFAQQGIGKQIFSNILIESDVNISSIEGIYEDGNGNKGIDIDFIAKIPNSKRIFSANFPDGMVGFSIEAMKDEEIDENETKELRIYLYKRGSISAIVKEGSIEGKHLRPNYLADIKIESGKAEIAYQSAEEKAKMAESFVHGGTGVRPDENTDNAEYYKNQAKVYYDNLQQAGNVTGVKGNSESNYRKGNVNITPENIGAPSNEYIAEHFAPDYVTSSNGAPSKKGWYRIAMAKQFGCHSCVISLKRRYNSPSPEYQKVQLMDVYTTKKFVSLAACSGTHFWSKIRYVLDENSSTSYIEIYQDRDTAENTWIITIEDAVGYSGFYMKAIAPVATEETVAGVKVLASLDLPANFDSDYLAKKDGSNVNGSWSNLIAGKALKDGNGNSFENTYALKNIYGDKIVSMGRKSGTTIGENSFCFGISGNEASAYGTKILAGTNNTANGFYATVLSGNENTSGGSSSASLGLGNISNNLASLAIGKYCKIMNPGGSSTNQVGDAMSIGNGTGNGNRSNALRITYAGDVLGTKAFQSSGADYAEFVKPWADGNIESEDRVGYFVTVRDGLLHKANEGDYICGITSGNPSVVGNADEDYYWRYERDEFNRIVMEDVPETVQEKGEDGNPVFEEETHEPVMVETGKIIKNARMKLAEGYDPSLQENYVERKDRKEWDYVGMVGVVPVRDDGTCIPGQFCKCGAGGVATAAETRRFDTFYVVERISENIVSVEMRG